MSCVSKLSSALKWGTCTHLLVTLKFKGRDTCKDTQYGGFTEKRSDDFIAQKKKILAKVTFY